MYASFKYGHTERRKGGRHFTDMDEGLLERLMSGIANLSVLEKWKTRDLRPGRESEEWLNLLLVKGGAQ